MVAIMRPHALSCFVGCLGCADFLFVYYISGYKILDAFFASNLIFWTKEEASGWWRTEDDATGQSRQKVTPRVTVGSTLDTVLAIVHKDTVRLHMPTGGNNHILADGGACHRKDPRRARKSFLLLCALISEATFWLSSTLSLETPSPLSSRSWWGAVRGDITYENVLISVSRGRKGRSRLCIYGSDSFMWCSAAPRKWWNIITWIQKDFIHYITFCVNTTCLGPQRRERRTYLHETKSVGGSTEQPAWSTLPEEELWNSPLGFYQ